VIVHGQNQVFDRGLGPENVLGAQVCLPEVLSRVREIIVSAWQRPLFDSKSDSRVAKEHRYWPSIGMIEIIKLYKEIIALSDTKIVKERDAGEYYDSDNKKLYRSDYYRFH